MTTLTVRRTFNPGVSLSFLLGSHVDGKLSLLDIHAVTVSFLDDLKLCLFVDYPSAEENALYLEFKALLQVLQRQHKDVYLW